MTDKKEEELKKLEEEGIIVINQNDVIINFPAQRTHRPKCTPEFTDRFVGYLRKGLKMEDVYSLMGTTRMSATRWRNKGIQRIYAKQKAEEQGMVLEDDVFEDWYVYFYEQTERAIPERKMALLEKIEAAGNDPRNWTALAWILERSYPDEFGRRMRHEVVDWRSKIIDLIKDGTVGFLDVAEELGHEQAKELFERAGKRIPESVESAEDNEES